MAFHARLQIITMTVSIAKIISLLLLYRYAILFPIVVFEGPIVTVIAGFFISLGKLSWLATVFVIVVADLTGDALHYAVGYSSRHRRATKLMAFLGINQKRLEHVERHFKKHPKKTLLLGKIAHGIGGIPLVAAGVAKMPFSKFMFINFIATIPKSLALLFIGYFFGQSLYKINGYLDTGAILILLAAIILAIIYLITSRMADKSSLE